jgi:hypothetical protein
MSQSASRRQRETLVALGVAVLLLLPVVVFAGVLWIPPLAARWQYEPREGDIVFQSLPSSRLSRAIEGATRSRYSHCGIVERFEGRWTVLEAYRGVARTPLSEWLARG